MNVLRVVLSSLVDINALVAGLVLYAHRATFTKSRTDKQGFRAKTVYAVLTRERSP